MKPRTAPALVRRCARPGCCNFFKARGEKKLYCSRRCGAAVGKARWIERHSDRYLAYQAFKLRRRRARDPEAQHKRDRVSRLATEYGLTVGDYEVMLIRQDGRCAICGDVDPHAQAGRFCIDHDHDTGKVRELLCGPCNTALGAIEDGAPVTNLIRARCQRYGAQFNAYSEKHRRLAVA